MSENYFYSSLSGQEIEDTLLGAVVFNSDQELTTSQKARARQNIGAGEGSTSFKILGFFATLSDLQEYLKIIPNPGDAYGISVNPTSDGELFSPDGVQTQFTLTTDDPPWHITVTESGTVLEPITDYAYAGGVITFVTAPAAGTDTIAVAWYDKTEPYNVYVWDGVTQSWIDNGALLSASIIDDNDILITKTWSSYKIDAELDAKQDAITVNGMLKGSGSAVSAATKGADYGALSFTVTLAAASWSSKQQTVSNANFFASGYAYIVSPASASFAAYGEAQIYADDVTTDGQMVFHCDSAPSADLTVNVVRVVSA